MKTRRWPRSSTRCSRSQSNFLHFISIIIVLRESLMRIYMGKGQRKIILYPKGKIPVLVRSGCCNKMPRTGGLINNRNSFPTVQQAGSLRSECQEGWVLGRAIVPVADGLLGPHTMEGARQQFCQGANPILETPSLSTSQRPHVLRPAPWGLVQE